MYKLLFGETIKPIEKYHEFYRTENVIFTVDCGKAEDALNLILGGQYDVNALALVVDYPLENVRMVLEEDMLCEDR